MNGPGGTGRNGRGMKKQVTTIGFAVLIAVATVTAAWAQVSRYGRTQGYATDHFEGFDALDEDSRIPQKKKSFWYSVDAETPAAQMQIAEKKEALGRNRSARKAYEALIREWPTAPEAAQAQYALAQLLERQGKYEKAFDEYQYLITHYAGHCPYQEVLDRQFRIANYLLHNNTSMFGWTLSGSDTIRERFEQIVRNAPRGAQAPEIMLVIGSIRVSEKELLEAIAVYQKGSQPLSADFPSDRRRLSCVKARYELAVKHSYNEPRCREAIAFIKSALVRIPNHPQKVQMTTWLNELTALLIEQNYQQAVFYDTKQRNAEAAKAAYRRFLTEFSDSHYAAQVRERLMQLEKGAAPLR